MNDIETQLRRALHAEAAGVDPDERTGLETVRRRGHAARQRRRAAVAGAALAIVVVAGLAVIPNLGGSDERLETPADDVTTTVPAPTVTTVPAPTVAPAPSIPDEALFPLALDQLSDDPVAVARGFVEAYFGETGEAPGESRFSAFRELEPGHGGLPSGEVDVFRVGEVGQVLDHVVSTISLAPLDGSHYFVVAAESDEVQLDSPERLATISSPLAADGRGRGYEGTIVVQVRDRQDIGSSLGQEATIAGCCETLEPFSVIVDFDPPTGELGAVVAHNDSGIAAVDAFTVLPVRFGPSGETTSFQVFFHRGEGPVVAVNRTVPKTPGVLRAALTALLAGPTADERSDGLESQFSSATASMLLDVRIDEGVATVELDERIADVLTSASASAASAALLAELDATVFQFDAVRSARYQLSGSCDAFASWLQLDSCERARP